MPFLWAALAVFGLTVAGVAAWSSLQEPEVARSGDLSPPSLAGAVADLDGRGVFDSDLDGLADALENGLFGTDPGAWGSSGTGIPDGWLARHGFDPLDPGVGRAPAASPPADALPAPYGGVWPPEYAATLWEVYSAGRPADWNETVDGAYENGLDPRDWDTSGDGIPDGWLLHHGLDPLDANIGTQSIGPEGSLPVRAAFENRTDPRRADTDGDGLLDADEVGGAARPDGGRYPPTSPWRWDTAGGGVCDGYLTRHGIDPHDLPSILGDPDLDGATTGEEFNWTRAAGIDACDGQGLDPTSPSSGGSPLPDGWLIRYGLDPLEPGIEARTTQDAATDPGPPAAAEDADVPNVVLTVSDEYRVNRPAAWDESIKGPWWGGTDPGRVDTDGDGLGDAWEVRGFNVLARSQVGPGEARARATSSDPARLDTDGDGLPDGQEADPATRQDDTGGRTDPRRWDTDFDGLDDRVEVALGLGLDPARADSAADHLRDGARLQILQARQAAYRQSLEYLYPGPPGSRSVSDWMDAMPGASDLPRPLSMQSAAALVSSGGDLDGDGVPNIVDPDMDEDGLLNGWEVDPPTYASSIHGLGDLPGGRPATDPLNPDTDGDLLRDGWEVRYGTPDYVLGRYNIDPSRWDTDGDGTDDAREDPDGDGVTWYAFDAGQRAVQEFPFTNLLEQQYEEQGADPNRFSSDGDGLADGWKVFWGLVYPGENPIPPGTVRPLLGQPQEEVSIVSARYSRVSLDGESLLPHETLAPTHHHGVLDPRGGTRTIYRVVGQMEFTFLQAQAAGTNPYLLDTDGDGMPDWWEVLHAAPLPGLSGPGGAVCADTVGPDPLMPDGPADPDGDGMDNEVEHTAGTLPLCADSDLGGIRDGAESQFGLDPALTTDDERLLRDGADTDGDGLLDFEELTGIQSVDYRYLGPTPVRTSHDLADSDGDGLLDGATQPNPVEDPDGWPENDPRAQRFLDLGIAYFRSGDGLFFMGEKDHGADPREPDDAGTGVPAGWLAAHNLPIHSTNPVLLDAYTLAKPQWWDQASHGPWWGGAAPDEDVDALRRDLDLDRDGLRDRDGEAGYEDPMPGNHDNAPRPVDLAAHGWEVPADAGPLTKGLHPEAQRMLAQAYLSPRVLEDTYSRDRSVQDDADRYDPCINLADASAVLVKGTPTVLEGTVTTCTDPVPLAGVTVEARLGGQVFGAAFTGQDGIFRLPVNVAAEQQVTMPVHALVLRQATGGTVTWEADASLPVGQHTMVVRSYATPQGAAYSDHVEPLRSALVPLQVTVRASSSIQLDAPPAATTGAPATVGIHLLDSGGAPIEGDLTVHWGGGSQAVRTGSDGRVVLALPTPHANAGIRTLTVDYAPPGNVAPYLSGSTATSTIHLRQPADLQITPPGSAEAGSTVLVNGRITVPSGSPGKVPIQVNASLAGQPIASAVATTSVTGQFSVTFALADDALRGDYILVAVSQPSDSTEASRTSVIMPVRSQPRFTDVSTANVTADLPSAVSARLVEPDGQPIADAPVRIRLGAKAIDVRSDAEGRVGANFSQALPRGPVQQEISFDGDAGHTGTAHRTTRLVAGTTYIDLASGRVGRGQSADVVLRLVDGQGAGVPGAVVTLKWGDAAPATLLTNASGGASLTHPVPAAAVLGDVPVLALFDGAADGSLAGSRAEAVWRVQSGARLEAPSGSFVAGQRVPDAVLVDALDGTPLAGRSITVALSTDATRTATTDTDGQFSILPHGTQGLTRRIEASLSFAGDDVYAPVDAVSILDFRLRSNTTLQTPQAAVAGRPFLVLVDVDGGPHGPAPGGEVEVAIDGEPQGRWAVEDGRGRANVTVDQAHEPGPAKLTVSYLGSPTHAPSVAETTLRVLAPVDLHLEAPRVGAGNVATVSVRATSGGEPVPFATIHLAVSGLESGLTARTDRDGVAQFRLDQGDHALQVAARYAGDQERGPALASLELEPSSTQVVGGDGALRVWVVGAILLLAALAGVAARLRRQPLEQAFRRARVQLDASGDNERLVLRAYRCIEDAAIGHGILFGAAVTAGALEEAMLERLPRNAHRPLRTVVGLFQAVRYGSATVSDTQKDTMIRALDAIIAHLESRGEVAA